MAKKKKKKKDDAPAGAPEWVMTYGDMMSLLLTFFIMLVAMSEIKKEDQWQAISEAVKRSFGMKVGGGSIPSLEDPKLQHLRILTELHLKKQPLKDTSRSPEKGPDGRHNKVTRPRQSMTFVVGAAIEFEPRSAKLNDLAKRQLKQIADQIRGKMHKVEVHGHCSAIELAEESDYPDLLSLSYERARVVQEYLVSPELKIKSPRIRVVANAADEPVRSRATDRGKTGPNRRVEVIVTDHLVEDFTKPEVGSFGPDN